METARGNNNMHDSKEENLNSKNIWKAATVIYSLKIQYKDPERGALYLEFYTLNIKPPK